MKKKLYAIIAAICLSFPKPAKADMWGADIPILLEILSNSISQLYQLMALVQQTQDSLSLIRDINSGINNALGVIQIIRQHRDAGLYGDWGTVDRALRNLEQIYGSVPRSSLSDVQRNTDQNIAEAITTTRNIFDVTNHYDQVGEQIQAHAQVTSPKGAAKLTAQSLGVVVQVMNESLRAQASGLKLQAQSLANENQREKQETRQFQDATKSLSNSLKTHTSSFLTPTF
jgi:hypothetical protein